MPGNVRVSYTPSSYLITTLYIYWPACTHVLFIDMDCDSCTAASGELEQSALSEYEERLERRRVEVRQLQKQRDELLTTQRKLQELQLSMTSHVSVML